MMLISFFICEIPVSFKVLPLSCLRDKHVSSGTFSSSLRQELRIGQETYSSGQTKDWDMVWSLWVHGKPFQDSNSSLRVLAATLHVRRLSILPKLRLGLLLVTALDSLCCGGGLNKGLVYKCLRIWCISSFHIFHLQSSPSLIASQPL